MINTKQDVSNDKQATHHRNEKLQQIVQVFQIIKSFRFFQVPSRLGHCINKLFLEMWICQTAVAHECDLVLEFGRFENIGVRDDLVEQTPKKTREVRLPNHLTCLLIWMPYSQRDIQPLAHWSTNVGLVEQKLFVSVSMYLGLSINGYERNIKSRNPTQLSPNKQKY